MISGGRARLGASLYRGRTGLSQGLNRTREEIAPSFFPRENNKGNKEPGKMNKKKLITYVLATPFALALCYGGKHIAHVKCVEEALDMQFKKHYQGYQQVESVDVPWWIPFSNNGYECSAKVAFAGGTTDISFTAKRAHLHEVAEDDWEVNLGFWGWLGDDYRIMNIKAK